MCLCVRKGGRNGKNKNPGRSGAARSPLLKPGWVGPGRSTARWRGCRNTGPVSQECFKRFSCHTWGGCSFIWNVLLRTANDQLKLDYFFLFVRQPAALAPARICADGKGIGQRKFAAHFSCLLSTLPLFFFQKPSIYPSARCRCVLVIYQSWVFGPGFEVTRVCSVIYRDSFEVFMEVGASYQEL